MENRSTLKNMLVVESDPDAGKYTRYVQVGYNVEQFEFIEQLRKKFKIRTNPELLRRILNAFIQQYQRIKIIERDDFS